MVNKGFLAIALCLFVSATFAESSQGGADCVTLYSECNFSGTSLDLCDDTPQLYI
jgi:hypothetical protein